MLYLTNAFSIAMLDGRAEKLHHPIHMTVERIGINDVKRLLTANPDYISAYGHELTAEKLEHLLEVRIPVNRKLVRLKSGDRLIVAQTVNMAQVYKKQASAYFCFHLIGIYDHEAGRKRTHRCFDHI